MRSPTPHMRSERVHSRLIDRLDPHGSSGARTALSGVVDLDAVEEQQYEPALKAIDDRLSQKRLSLVSMVVSGIYFGLLVGFWLVDFSSWPSILVWILPVGLVTIYAGYSSHLTVRQIHQLSEAHILLQLLVEEQSVDAAGEKT